MRSLLLALLLILPAFAPATTETLALRLSAVVSLEHAVALESNAPVSYQQAAANVYQDMTATIIAQRQAGAIPAEAALACSFIITEAARQSQSPENVTAIWQQVTAVIARGTWEGLGLPAGMLPTPTPELRAGLEALLEGFVAAKRTELAAEV